MALIVKCRKCRRRVPRDATACPACSSTSFRFIVDYWPNGRRGGRRQRTIPAATIQEALKTEKAIMGVKHKPVAIVSPLSTVADLFPEYLRWMVRPASGNNANGSKLQKFHRAVTTWHDVSGSWERDLKRIFGQYAVVTIDAAHYSLYQTMRGKVSNRTINKELDYFSGFLKWCRREKKLSIPRVDYEKLTCARHSPIVLSPGEIIKIIDAAESEPVYHALLIFLYILGVRISAARGVKVEDFDFENRRVRVVLKGGDEKLLPVTDHVIESVKRVIKLKNLKAGQYVFSVTKDGDPIQNIRKAIARICKRASVTKKVYPHLFRHTHGTHLIEAGVNTRTVQDMMGHAEITTTEGYTHIAIEQLRKAQNALVSTRKPNNSAGSLYGCEYNI
jgi:integrase/recombinase XerD